MGGEVPRDWKWTRLGEHFAQVRRKNTAGVTRVLTASGEHGLIDQEEFFNKRVAAKDLDGYYHLKRGEFAYNRSSMKGYPCGAIKRLDRYDDGVLSTLYLCFGLRPGAGVAADYAAQMFDSGVLNDQLSPIARVGARAHGLLNVTPADFMDVSFPLPPLPEQKKIAAILSSVDEAIQATQAVIEQTRRVKEGLLQELLTRGIGHTRFKQTPIGEIPEEWEVMRVHEVTSRVTDGTHQAVKTQSKGDHRFLYVTCVRPERIVWENATWVGSDTYRSISKGRKPERGCILYTAVGATLGFACVVDTDEPFTFQRHIAILYPRRDRIRPRFLSAFLNSPETVRTVWSLTVGNAQPTMTLGALKDLRVPLPSLEEQDKIVSAISATDGALGTSEDSVRAFASAKSALLHDLLTGAVRVTP